MKLKVSEDLKILALQEADKFKYETEAHKAELKKKEIEIENLEKKYTEYTATMKQDLQGVKNVSTLIESERDNLDEELVSLREKYKTLETSTKEPKTNTKEPDTNINEPNKNLDTQENKEVHLICSQLEENINVKEKQLKAKDIDIKNKEVEIRHFEVELKKISREKDEAMAVMEENASAKIQELESTVTSKDETIKNLNQCSEIKEKIAELDLFEKVDMQNISTN